MTHHLYRSGEPVALGERLADSGEATVRRIADRPGWLAKLYHPDRLDETRAAKIAAQVAFRPDDPSLGGFHRAFAWPEDAICAEDGRPVGLLIPEVPGARSLTALASVKLRRRKAAEINWTYLHGVAANLAFTLERLHGDGLCVGDLKPENVLVDDRALVTLIDCDSWQIPDPRDGADGPFLCPVGSEGFTAPELIGKPLARTPRTAESDRFALAVLIHQLLLGRHPWTGEWLGGGDPPARDRLIRSGDWPERRGSRLRAPTGATPLAALDPALQRLFHRAFDAGIETPEARPTAGAWHEALCLAMAGLETCPERPHHHYAPDAGACPWCARLAETGSDPFPDPAESPDPFAALALAFERALARGDARMALELWRDHTVLRGHAVLRRYATRMEAIGRALDAFDRWAALYRRTAGDGAPDWRGLAAIWESEPALAERRLLAGEEVAGRPALEIVDAMAEHALAIPLTPPERLLVTPDVALHAAALRQGEGRETIDDSLDIPPMPTRMGPEPAPEASPARAPTPEQRLGYRIDPGWAGLRPAQLTLLPAARGRLPALRLVCADTGEVFAETPAGQPRKRDLTIGFETPDTPRHLILRTADPADAPRLAIEHPPLKHRRLGPRRGGDSGLRLAPAE